MFNNLLGLGLVFAHVFLFVFLVGGGGTIRVRTVLELLLLLLLLGLIMEVRRGDESDDLFERMFWVFPNEEVYEGGYATEKALKVADYQCRPEFGGRGAVIGFEWYGYC